LYTRIRINRFGWISPVVIPFFRWKYYGNLSNASSRSPGETHKYGTTCQCRAAIRDLARVPGHRGARSFRVAYITSCSPYRRKNPPIDPSPTVVPPTDIAVSITPSSWPLSRPSGALHNTFGWEAVRNYGRNSRTLRSRTFQYRRIYVGLL